MPNVMVAQPNIGGAFCESSVIPCTIAVWLSTPAAGVPCSKTPFTRYNRLSNRFYNRIDNGFDNLLYRVYKHLPGYHTGLTTGLTSGCIV